MSACYEKFAKIIESKNLSAYRVAKDTGLTTVLFTDWKKGKSKPKYDKLRIIADYLGVEVDDLTDSAELKVGLDFGTTYSAAAVTGLDPIPVGKSGKRPVYGKVGAGEGAFAEDHIVGWELVDEKYDNDDYFYLRVQGSSMSPRIEDGDLVLVKKQSALDNGNIGVFLVDGTDGLVKKIEYDQSHISLISFNTIYQPMIFVNEDMTRVAIIGKVVELKRVF